MSPPRHPFADEPHVLFDSKSVKTAKCDQCNKRNKCVVQRCQLCNVQLCKPCLHNPESDGRHKDMGDCNWIESACEDYKAMRNKSTSQGLKRGILNVPAASPNVPRVQNRIHSLEDPAVSPEVTRVQKRKRSFEDPAKSPEAASVKKQKNSHGNPVTPKPKGRNVHFRVTPTSETRTLESFFVPDHGSERDRDETVDEDETEDDTSNADLRNFEPPQLGSKEIRTRGTSNAADAFPSPKSINSDAPHLEKGQGKKDRQTSNARDDELPLFSDWSEHQHHVKTISQQDSAKLSEYQHQGKSLSQQIREATEENGAIFSLRKEGKLTETEIQAHLEAATTLMQLKQKPEEYEMKLPTA